MSMTNGKHDPYFVGKLIRRDTTCPILGGRILWKRILKRETGCDKYARDFFGYGWGTGDLSNTLVEVQCYKSEGRWFDRSWCLSISFRSHYGPGVDSAPNRNEYREHFLGLKAAGVYDWQTYHNPVPLLRNLGTLTFWNLLGHSRPVTGLLYLKVGEQRCAVAATPALTPVASGLLSSE